MHSAFKIFSHVVLLLMVLALLYAGYISVENWSSVGV
jgi:hypothetical protein